jgi:hypothetical protein
MSSKSAKTMLHLRTKIKRSLRKFNLDLTGRIILTEAATGNFVVTPIIAALGGAEVYAITKNSKYGSVEEVTRQTNLLADIFNLSHEIHIITAYDQIDLGCVDILTNTGFNRPIDHRVVQKLSSNCVIPLMWEPWEYRESDVNIDACCRQGIKVYGTNESDPRLRTLDYIGLLVIHLLLQHKKSPFGSHILVLGNERFADPALKMLNRLGYGHTWIDQYRQKITDIAEYDTIVCLEHINDDLLIGEGGAIESNLIDDEQLIIHIAGNVSFDGLTCRKLPPDPAPFGSMSFTLDYVDPMAVIDLHTAGLKVAEGMLSANALKLPPKKYKVFMESNYPALAFSNPKYW